MAPIITFIDWYESDNSTIVAGVVSHLKAFGYRVAVIKSSVEKGLAFDPPGMDVQKCRQAGADAMLLVAPDQMILQAKNTQQSLTTLAHHHFSDVDIIIGEGFLEARRIAKIEVVHNKDNMLRDEVHGVIATVTDLDIVGDNVFRHDAAEEIALFLKNKYLADKARPKVSVSLLVNGKKVPLKKFVQEILASTVVGLVGALRFPENGQEIDLRIRTGSEKKV